MNINTSDASAPRRFDKDSSLQEIGSFVVQNLRKQGKKSVHPNTNPFLYGSGMLCAYRGDDGCKCAAGWLIPDDKYSPSMENIVVYGIPFFSLEFSDAQLFFIERLQRIHDFDWEDREARWAELFPKYNLTLPEKEG